ncbi:hypothetical protein [Gluconobacter wancherniae]|uniref:hypothetical protein n=1 Tax=Gluconobacter wancherniae TaxID=1307955 RepID=UPI0031FE8ECF
MVGILLDDAPALFLRVGAADAKLVGDRGVALVVGGIAGVERDLHDEVSLRSGATTLLLLLRPEPVPCRATGHEADQRDQARVGGVGSQGEPQLGLGRPIRRGNGLAGSVRHRRSLPTLRQGKQAHDPDRWLLFQWKMVIREGVPERAPACGIVVTGSPG